MKRVRKRDHSRKRQDEKKANCEYIHVCRHCGEEFPSNCAVRGWIVGAHEKRCFKKLCGVCPVLIPQKVVEQVDDGDEMVEDEEMDFFECQQGDVESQPAEGDASAHQGESDAADGDCDEDDDNWSVQDVPYFDSSEAWAAQASAESTQDQVGQVTQESLNCVNVEMVMSAVDAVPSKESKKPGFWHKIGDYVNRPIFASDFFCCDHFAAAAVKDGHLPVAPKPDDSMLQYQRSIIDTYFTPVGGPEDKPFRTTKVDGEDKDWRDMSLVYYFTCAYNMSVTGGSALLTLIHTICAHRGVSLPMHTSWKSLKTAVEKKLSFFHPLLRYAWHLPSGLFGRVDLKGKPLKPVVSVSYDLMKTIALRLLFVNPLEFHHAPPLPERIRFISGFHTSDFFINLCAALWAMKGATAVPLCLMFSWDKSMNASNLVGMTPLVFSFQQTSGESDGIHLAGYFPCKLSQSDEELLKLLEKIWKTDAVGLRNQALTLAKRKYILDYPHSVLSVLLGYEENGLLLQVGTGPSAQTFHFYPFVTSIPTDNQEGDRFNGTSAMKTSMNGRFSTDTETWSFPETRIGQFQVRDPKLMALIGSKCEKMVVQELYYCRQQALASTPAEKAAAKPSADERKQWSELILEQEYFGVTAGTNLNYDLTAGVESMEIMSYPLLFGPDTLHTFLKGMVENIISWTILIVQSFDRALGTTGLTELDERLKIFPIHQAFAPVRPVKFTEGIIGFMKAESLKGKSTSRSTGLVSCKSSSKIINVACITTPSSCCTSHSKIAHMEASSSPPGFHLFHKQRFIYSS